MLCQSKLVGLANNCQLLIKRAFRCLLISSNNDPNNKQLYTVLHTRTYLTRNDSLRSRLKTNQPVHTDNMVAPGCSSHLRIFICKTIKISLQCHSTDTVRSRHHLGAGLLVTGSSAPIIQRSEKWFCKVLTSWHRSLQTVHTLLFCRTAEHAHRHKLLKASPSGQSADKTLSP